MSLIKFEYADALKFVTENEIRDLAAEVKKAGVMLERGTGEGNDFLG